MTILLGELYSEKDKGLKSFLGKNDFYSITTDGPPTTTPSERDFSMGTDIITPKRNRLSEKKIEYLSFLKRNLDRDFD